MIVRARLLVPLLCAACGSSPGSAGGPPSGKAGQEEELVQKREAETFTEGRPLPVPTEAERKEFARIWELFRKGDKNWPIERDRFKRRSEAASTLLSAHLLRYYMQVNSMRDRAGKDLMRAKNEIVEVGGACAPNLVDMMVLDRIPMGGGNHFLVDDITRQDCLDMLERMGPQAVPPLLRALDRGDLSPKGRRHIALALGGTRDRRGYDPLVRLLRSDRSWQVRADAATALAKLGDRRALAPLGEAEQKDADPAVRLRASKARKELLGPDR